MFFPLLYRNHIEPLEPWTEGTYPNRDIVYRATPSSHIKSFCEEMTKI